MPSTWNDSYRELERCLRKLRDERKSQYWHVRERFIAATSHRIEVPLTPAGKPKLPAHSELDSMPPIIRGRHAIVHVRKWNPAVRNQKVVRGVDYLASTFRGEPFLPAELRSRAAA